MVTAVSNKFFFKHDIPETLHGGISIVDFPWVHQLGLYIFGDIFILLGFQVYRICACAPQ